MWGGKKWEAKELRIEFQEEGLGRQRHVHESEPLTRVSIHSRHPGKRACGCICITVSFLMISSRFGEGLCAEIHPMAYVI